MLSTDQAFKKVKEKGITSSIQVFRRWLREGRIKAEVTDNRKAGYQIDVEDLQRFIDENTTVSVAEYNELKAKYENLIKELENKNQII